MKVLFLADVHCHNHAQFSQTLPSGRNSRLQDCVNVLFQAAQICLKKNVDYAVLAGDLFESWTKIDLDVLYGATDGLEALSKSVKQLFWLSGNHDQYDKKGTVISGRPFGSLATVLRTSWVTSLSDGTETLRIAFQPYTADHSEFNSFVASLNNAVDVFVFHQPLAEAIIPGSGLALGKGLSMNALPEGVRYCIGGDIHKRQQLRQNIYYLGSPLQLDFSEAGEEKGFSLLNTEDWSLTFIPSHAPRFFYFPSAKAFWDSQDDYSSFDFIRVSCTQEEAVAILGVSPMIQIILQTETVEAKERIKTNVSDADLLTSFVEKFGGDLDPARLLEKGLMYLRGSE